MHKAHLAIAAVTSLPLLILHVIHKQTIDQGELSFVWLQVVRSAMTDRKLMSLVFQFHMVFGIQLFCLYGLYINRQAEVFIFSHLRFVLANFIVALVGFTYYRAFIALSENATLIAYISIVLATIVLMPFVGMIQAAVVVGFDAIGKEPIVRDLVRSEIVGKIGDFNSWIIRRWGQYVMLWFLLIPGFVLHAPFPEWLAAALAGISFIISAITLFSCFSWYFR